MLLRKARAALYMPLALALATTAQAQQSVTTPEQQFGHKIGADYVLPNYQQLVSYWQKLDAESDRMTMVDIGKTAEGRTQYMAIVTSPENHKNLARYKQIAQRLARAESLSDEQAHALAREGKAIVWIDGGLHATEVLGAQQLMETVYQLVSRDDAETRRILDDVIVLAVHANPDGMDLVSNWYMREKDPQKRNSNDIPRLYQKYIGHDNNRDFYAVTQPESQNMNRQLYTEWNPQIMYNHHQTGPTGTVMFAPPFRDPFNYVYDPLIVTGLDLVGAAMHNRFVAEQKPGVTMRRGANYSTWWNGGLRTTVYFHNMIGLLTETIGNPTPMEIPFVAARQLPSADLPFPIAPQVWHFRNSIDYSVTANYAVLDLASRYRETFLFNIYQMGKNSIERGSRDTWTTYPSRIDQVDAAMRQDRSTASGASSASGVMAVGGLMRGAPDGEAAQKYFAMLRSPETRDPRGYIIPANQADFPTAVKFVNTLLMNGINVERATADFEVAGKKYPAGSLVVKTAQPYRPHVLDMFEPQDHPHDFLYEGGPPIPPYDAAGWTLAYQMGIGYDRILDAFDGPFERVNAWTINPPAGKVAEGPAVGYLLSPRYVDGFRAVSRLLGEKEQVQRLQQPWQNGSTTYEAGTFYIPAKAATRAKLEKLATQLGIDFAAATARPSVPATTLRQPRIALWDRYGGSMPSGWTRWLLEQYEIPFEVVYPAQLDAGNLKKKYDVIVFPDGGMPRPGATASLFDRMPDAASIPAEFRNRLGSVSQEKTVPQLADFLRAGGTVVTIGSSTSLAQFLGLPIGNKLVDKDGKPLKREDYYIPGSVLKARVDASQPLAFGMNEQVDVFFDNSPVFTLGPDAEAQGIRKIAWFDTAEPLRSGWAWGQKNLEGGAAIVQAPVGKGSLYLFGPEVLYRGQPHGTFKFFFNSLYN